ncbi:PrsW family intramembrane metalloprotease [Streptomyces sp. WMMC500]|uniref:PrsW family intramembrane metalloprotease n=1 Tax=Streptomyces sp. WMMC500 TaxID=3015154 RepID=UPI00248C52F6|nr:PrsW family intramembrane metalloprotease [Streptomyces sp. WMMC500]WBB63974.1 PrsW family intramembrane metalloprotease [Streptomyces sp. WMMC500]
MQDEGAQLMSRPREPEEFGPRPVYEDARPKPAAPVPPTPRRFWRRRGVRIGAVATVLTLAGLAILALVWLETGTHGMLVGSGLALLPVPLLIAGFLWLDRVAPGPWRYRIFAFAWGAFAATLVAMLANTFAARWIATGLPTASSREADLWGMAVVAPVVEETAKAAAILLLFLFRRHYFAGLVDGLVLAGIIGTGFAFTENILYLGRAYEENQTFGDSGPLATVTVTFIARVVFSPFAHPLFTAMGGIGFGLAAMTLASQRVRRVLLPTAGLLLAIALHSLWNGSAVMNGFAFLGAYAFVMAPVFGLVVWLSVWSRGGKLRTIRAQLPAYTHAGWLVPAEPVALSSFRTRKLARTFARQAHGEEARRAVADYTRSATTLALLRAQATRGHPPKDYAEREQALLARMWSTKAVAQPALTRAAYTTTPPHPPHWPMPGATRVPGHPPHGGKPVPPPPTRG